MFNNNGGKKQKNPGNPKTEKSEKQKIGNPEKTVDQPDKKTKTAKLT